MNLYEPTMDFPFSSIVLNTPTSLNETGTYFSKMTFKDGKPVYIQFPKSKTKNGIILSKHECYIDLLYSHGSQQNLMDWTEQLEECCKELICVKKDLWFSQELDNQDIDRLLSSVMRPYKGGSMHLVRVVIDKSKMTNTFKCKLYDEEENAIHNFESITSHHDIIPLVHLEGIRFTPNSIDIILKVTQIMIFNTDKSTMDECLIKPIDFQQDSSVNTLEDCEVSQNNVCLNEENELPENNITLGELSQLPDESIGLSEVNISLDDEKEVLSLKNPNEVYEEIYKSALDKARNIKSQSLLAYLEAKQIKTKYMLDYLDDIDDEYENMK